MFNGQPTGKYELTITLTEEQAADAEANGLSIQRSEYNGQSQVKAKLKTKFPLNSSNFVGKVATRDANGKPTSWHPFTDDLNATREIPRGSTVSVVYTTKPYEMMGKSGVSNYLLAVQVIEENSAIEFDDYDEPANHSDEEFQGEF